MFYFTVALGLVCHCLARDSVITNTRDETLQGTPIHLYHGKVEKIEDGYASAFSIPNHAPRKYAKLFNRPRYDLILENDVKRAKKIQIECKREDACDCWIHGAGFFSKKCGFDTDIPKASRGKMRNPTGECLVGINYVMPSNLKDSFLCTVHDWKHGVNSEASPLQTYTFQKEIIKESGQSIQKNLQVVSVKNNTMMSRTFVRLVNQDVSSRSMDLSELVVLQPIGIQCGASETCDCSVTILPRVFIDSYEELTNDLKRPLKCKMDLKKESNYKATRDGLGNCHVSLNQEYISWLLKKKRGSVDSIPFSPTARACVVHTIENAIVVSPPLESIESKDHQKTRSEEDIIPKGKKKAPLVPSTFLIPQTTLKPKVFYYHMIIPGHEFWMGNPKIACSHTCQCAIYFPVAVKKNFKEAIEQRVAYCKGESDSPSNSCLIHVPGSEDYTKLTCLYMPEKTA